MAKFASRKISPKGLPIDSSPGVFTHEGSPAAGRDAKSELFLTAISTLVEPLYYESSNERLDRIQRLVASIVQTDEAWVARLVPYLRNEVNLRSIAIVIAGEYAFNKGTNARSVVTSAMSRADEPAEMLAYWFSQHGRALPKSVKKGVADGAVALYSEYSLLKYKGNKAAVSAGDVLNLTHPKPVGQGQSDLFRRTLDAYHGNAMTLHSTALTPMSNIRTALELTPVESRRDFVNSGVWADTAKEGGITWEYLSGWLPGGMDGEAWDAAIPQMGYMALLRNLRNFDEAGISGDSFRYVSEFISNPDRVAKSRQLPMRFLSAYKNVSNVRWHQPISLALDLSLKNIDVLPGRSLILVDVSGSMQMHVSGRSYSTWAEQAELMGSALAIKNPDSDLVAFSTEAKSIPIPRGGSTLHLANSFRNLLPGIYGGGTNLGSGLNYFNDHDRIIVITDEQYFSGYSREPSWPAANRIYVFNLVGYKAGIHTDERTKYNIGGGLSDNSFKILNLLDSGVGVDYPF